MALSRIGFAADHTALFARSFYAVSAPLLRDILRHPHEKEIHASVVRHYPEAPRLTLPSNVSEIFNIETGRFAPERARDIAAPLFLFARSHEGDRSFGQSDSARMHQLDSRVDSYDCFGAVSLNGSMQTNVPKPFCASGRATYLNMPGGMWARDGKYLAEVMRKSHFTVYQMRHAKRSGGLDGFCRTQSLVTYYSTVSSSRSSSSSSGSGGNPGDKKMAGATPLPVNLSKKEKLKIIIKDYGRTVVVFHIGISLVSLGIFYSLVSSGLDVKPIIAWFSSVGSVEKPAEIGEDQLVSNIMGEGSTFLVAYAIHKLFAPVRLSLTLGLTPMIVKYLRRKGIISTPKPIPKMIETSNRAGRGR